MNHDITPHLEAVRAYAETLKGGGAGHQQEMGEHLQALVDWIDDHKGLGAASTKGPSAAEIKESTKAAHSTHSAAKHK